MYTLIAVIIILLVFIGLASLYSVFKSKLQFIVTGLDAGFSIPDVLLLWNVAQLCELDQPTSLFFSIPSLTKCMAQISAQAQAEGTDKSPKIQNLLSKLFDYRTKVQNESDDKKGLNTTHTLEKGQKLRIILPGKGVFVSEIVNNGSQIIISVPRQNNLIPITAEEWVGKVISVYLWRKGDARYVFDTTVLQHGLFLGKSSLYLKHSSNLVRTQKRKSVRAKCEIYANLYIIKSKNVDFDTVETQNGYRCLLEDISESGALIRIGGKGVQNVIIKLQFNIQNKLIIMGGVVRTVDYNEQENQSLLHFECTHIDPVMRNEVLSFVYNMLPESEKEVLEAISQTEVDFNEDPDAVKATAEEENSEKKSELNENSLEEPAPLAEDLSEETIEDTEDFIPPAVEEGMVDF